MVCMAEYVVCAFAVQMALLKAATKIQAEKIFFIMRGDLFFNKIDTYKN
jgi:hypothetical protein